MARGTKSPKASKTLNRYVKAGLMVALVVDGCLSTQSHLFKNKETSDVEDRSSVSGQDG